MLKRAGAGVRLVGRANRPRKDIPLSDPRDQGPTSSSLRINATKWKKIWQPIENPRGPQNNAFLWNRTVHPFLFLLIYVPMLSVYEITCTYAQGTLEGMVYFRNLPSVSALFHEISYAEICNISWNSADSGMKEKINKIVVNLNDVLIINWKFRTL